MEDLITAILAGIVANVITDLLRRWFYDDHGNG